MKKAAIVSAIIVILVLSYAAGDIIGTKPYSNEFCASDFVCYVNEQYQEYKKGRSIKKIAQRVKARYPNVDAKKYLEQDRLDFYIECVKGD